MSIEKLFSVEQETVDEGITVEIGNAANGEMMTCRVSFMSASGNSKYDKILARLSKPHRRKLASGSLDDETSRRLGLRAFVKAILLGWDNVIMKDDEPPLPFTEENAIMLLEKYPLFYEMLIGYASDVSLFQESDDEDDEAAAGN